MHKTFENLFRLIVQPRIFDINVCITSTTLESVGTLTCWRISPIHLPKSGISLLRFFFSIFFFVIPVSLWNCSYFKFGTIFLKSLGVLSAYLGKREWGKRTYPNDQWWGLFAVTVFSFQAHTTARRMIRISGVQILNFQYKHSSDSGYRAVLTYGYTSHQSTKGLC